MLGGDVNADWASTNLGIFICMQVSVYFVWCLLLSSCAPSAQGHIELLALTFQKCCPFDWTVGQEVFPVFVFGGFFFRFVLSIIRLS